MLAHCRTAFLLTTALLVTTAHASAVDTSLRLHTAFPAQWEPTVGLGLIFRVPLGAAPEPTPTPGGPATLHVRNWFLNASIAGALNTRDLDSPIGYGQLGLVRRVHLGPIDRAGVVVVGSLGPTGLGPALRFEAVNGVVGIQPGWMWFEDNRNGPAISLDVSVPFIVDLLFKH
jgi:hypothetical protein